MANGIAGSSYIYLEPAGEGKGNIVGLREHLAIYIAAGELAFIAQAHYPNEYLAVTFPACIPLVQEAAPQYGFACEPPGQLVEILGGA